MVEGEVLKAVEYLLGNGFLGDHVIDCLVALVDLDLETATAEVDELLDKTGSLGSFEVDYTTFVLEMEDIGTIELLDVDGMFDTDVGTFSSVGMGTGNAARRHTVWWVEQVERNVMSGTETGFQAPRRGQGRRGGMVQKTSLKASYIS